MVAGQGLLIEDCGIPTEETPLCRLYDVARVILYREADVENLKTKCFISDFRLVKVRPGSHCPHQRSIRTPGRHRRMCQSTGTAGSPHVLQAGSHCPLPPGTGPTPHPEDSRLSD